MLSSLLPGVRELRGPLAAGYLWLVVFWLALGDELPTGEESKSAALDRAYRLEPVLSAVGLAVVVSVAAYVIGSIVIDVQVRMAQVATAGVRPPGVRVRSDLDFIKREKRRLILMPVLAGVGWFAITDWLVPDSTLAKVALGVLAVAYVAFNLYWTQEGDGPRGKWVNVFRNRHVRAEPLKVTSQGRGELVRWLHQAVAGPRAVGADIAPPALAFMTDNRNLLKTRVLAGSEALHSEVDRPDAEATFRMAIWPPLGVLAIYLAAAVNPLWLLALVVPAILAWQWVSLREQANDALVTVLASSEDLGRPVVQHVREDVVRRRARETVGGDSDVVDVTTDIQGETYRHTALVETADGRRFEVQLDYGFNVLASEEQPAATERR
jgi:hypothetical protein